MNTKSTYPEDVGLGTIIANAAKEAKAERKGKAARGIVVEDVLEQSIADVVPSEKPAMKDQFGVEVDPVTRYPGYVIGFRGVAELVVNDANFTQLLIDNEYKANIFRIMANRGYVADQIVVMYKLKSADGAVSHGERDALIERVGELWNRNDRLLNQFFGADMIKPGHLDGSVRAKNAFEKIDSDMGRFPDMQENAKALKEYLAGTQSWYRDLSLPEIDCRMNETGFDRQGERNFVESQKARALRIRQGRNRAIRDQLTYDAQGIEDPRNRPASTDVIPGPSNTPVIPPHGGSGHGGKEVDAVSPNTLYYELDVEELK
ncbi:hypothetical protein E0H39_35725 [Rhizobium leguminosarum bv. viciae]|uniref:hypothetical protein n=1 Tax=Rhizobium leguminosarum TaxID=384 RepID=UPI001038BF80|nr:hypothetical protein [Rhizobium leguminosarum]NEJ80358.1 hypothetical protein [Rhizobium leguminosarum]TBY54129.1 hypothetical protein E0H39_35725 [Rhizobium leguminosarum bv. viciae]